jgi:O-antigen/teichoic acid export membrane protein
MIMKVAILLILGAVFLVTAIVQGSIPGALVGVVTVICAVVLWILSRRGPDPHVPVLSTDDADADADAGDVSGT